MYTGKTMDYYKILGIKRGSTTEEIKQAYRSLAMKHHPDRGGDEKRFKEISNAYENLIDPRKKQTVDSSMHSNHGPTEFHFHAEDIQDIFDRFGFGNQQSGRNKHINVKLEIELEDVLLGKDVGVEITLQNRSKKTINISIPAGIEHGQQIRYQGIGDHSNTNFPPGDLLVTVLVRQHPVFRRKHETLICEKQITAWEAITGGKLTIISLKGKTLDITIPRGTQPETVLSCKGEGLPNIRSRVFGNLLVIVKVLIPKNLSAEQLELVERLKDGS